jgi:hypothetical protein
MSKYKYQFWRKFVLKGPLSPLPQGWRTRAACDQTIKVREGLKGFSAAQEHRSAAKPCKARPAGNAQNQKRPNLPGQTFQKYFQMLNLYP